MSALLSDMIGFGLVVFASAGICAALNVQKYVHIKNTDPSTGQPMVSFMEIPLWWVGTIGNLVAEIMNLAALGYAPATLVTPLGCLTVVFNAVAAHLLLGEPFLRQDAIGITFIIVGVVCVVFSQVGEPQPPITPTCVHAPSGQPCTGLSEVVVSGGFWILIAIVVVGLFLMYRYVHEQYCQKYAWVYLVESSLVSSLTIVSARCFASFLGFPMPGKWSNFWISPDWVYAWGCKCPITLALLLHHHHHHHHFLLLLLLLLPRSRAARAAPSRPAPLVTCHSSPVRSPRLFDHNCRWRPAPPERGSHVL